MDKISTIQVVVDEIIWILKTANFLAVLC